MIVERHVNQLQQALAAATDELRVAGQWGRRLAQVLPAGGRLLVAGNGGSAAQAQHLTAELVGRYVNERAPVSAIALHAETSSLTAIANDYGIEQMYARQVRAHGRPGDVCLFLTTSGRSPNVIAAAEAARASVLRTWAMTGPAPNPLLEKVDDAIVIEAAQTCTIQEVHLVALHVLCEEFDAALLATDRMAGATPGGIS
jgi:D-sedoheptulose 7-phosphate isomerase